MNPKVDEYLDNVKNWKAELVYLRSIVLDCQLIEDFKWKVPCYSYRQKNVLILAPFKSYCAINFFKGSFLADEHKLLIKPGENTQAGRMVRFTNIKDIIEKETILRAYIYDAIEVEKAGLKIAVNPKKELHFPTELVEMFTENIAFKNAFLTLTLGKQRAYNIYFSAAQQSKTRADRILKYLPRILEGKGFNDCICGLSKKMPICDGSHKNLKS